MKILENNIKDVQIGLLSVKNCKASEDQTQFEKKVNKTVDEIVQRYGALSRKQLKKKSPIHVYAEYYKKHGYSYHVLGQLESFLKGNKTLEGNNSLLKVLFLTELESMLLMACHDIDQVELPLTVGQGSGDKEIYYTGIGGREQTIKKNDFFIRDGKGVISSILKGPDDRTRISSKTENALFIIYAPSALESLSDYVQQTLDDLENLLIACFPDCIIEEKSIIGEP